MGGATGGVQYAVVNNDGRWSTRNLWLITATESGLRVTDLTNQVSKEVDRILKEKRPLNSQDYAVSWMSNTDAKTAFTGSKVLLDFSAAIPKQDDTVEGSITLDMARDTIGKIVCNTPRDDPFEDNPELAKADHELNQTYATLLGRLNETAREALKKEQRTWVTSRDFNAEDENARPADQTRDQSLIESTKDRTADLKKRLGE